MQYQLKKLVYLKDKNMYYIPCIITHESNDTMRITFNKNTLKCGSQISFLCSKRQVQKPLIGLNDQNILLPCYIISKVQEYLPLYKNMRTMLELDFPVSGVMHVDIEDVVKYNDALEYFNSVLNKNNEDYFKGDDHIAKAIIECSGSGKVESFESSEIEKNLMDALVRQFNKGNFKSEKGKPLFYVEPPSRRENYSLDEIAEKVASLASEKLNAPKAKHNEDKKVLIEFYGGPSSGKSLHAYSLSNFLKLNLKDKVVEFSKEQAQEMYWEGRISSMSNMIKVLGRQTEHYDVRFDGGADVVVADTALDLAYYYDNTIRSMMVKDFIIHDMYVKYPNRIKVFCDRQGDESSYTTTGRLQSFEKSKEIDKSLSNMFKPFDVNTNDITWQDKVLTLTQKMMLNE